MKLLHVCVIGHLASLACWKYGFQVVLTLINEISVVIHQKYVDIYILEFSLIDVMLCRYIGIPTHSLIIGSTALYPRRETKLI